MPENNLSLDEAAVRFLDTLSPEEKAVSLPEVYRFVRWYGRERPFAQVTAPAVGNYAERLSQSDTDHAKKLELIRAFLVYAKKVGWTGISLATHLKVKKGKTSPRSKAKLAAPDTMQLTKEGYADLEAELATFKRRRIGTIDEVQKAAADKDFRENAPLEAARQQLGHIEGRIKGLEATLKIAVIIDDKAKRSFKASVGDTVILRDMTTGKELRYTLVSPREVNPIKGKISDVSPIGRAIIGKRQGEEVDVTVPAGKLRFEITQIER